MENVFVVVRDVAVIVAALAVVLMSGFMGAVAWQVYRLARELRAEVQPIIDAFAETGTTVRQTAEFMRQRAPEHPLVALVGAASGLKEAAELLRQFYEGIDRRQPDERQAEVNDVARY